MLVLPSATSRMTLRSTLIFHVTRKNIYKRKESANAQIIYHCGTIPKNILGIFIYIFTIGKVWHGHVLISYAIDGEVNHNQYSTHNGAKS